MDTEQNVPCALASHCDLQGLYGGVCMGSLRPLLFAVQGLVVASHLSPTPQGEDCAVDIDIQP